MTKSPPKSTTQNHQTTTMTTTTTTKPSHTKSTQKGKIGEDRACAWLESNGFVILERNFHSRFGEIDIIALEASNTNEGNECEACEDLKRKEVLEHKEILGREEDLEEDLWCKLDSKESKKDFVLNATASKSTLHFIEVKSYTKAEPAYAITQKKLSKIYQSIEAYFLDMSKKIQASTKEIKSATKITTKSSTKLCRTLENIDLDSLPYCVSAVLIKGDKISFLSNVSQNT